MSQILQLIGALTILLPFVLLQCGRLATQSLPSILLNAVGSALLAVPTARGRQWGVVLLEGT